MYNWLQKKNNNGLGVNENHLHLIDNQNFRTLNSHGNKRDIVRWG